MGEIVLQSLLFSSLFIIFFVFLYIFKMSKIISIFLIKSALSSLLMRIVDLEGLKIALQIKDDKYRYIFHNTFLKKNLYPDESNILDRNDYEIVTGKRITDHEIKEIIEDLFHNISIKNYNNLDYKSVCFLTDVYTRYSGDVCRFIEVVGDRVLDVYKIPIFVPILGFKFIAGIYILKYQGPEYEEKIRTIYRNCNCLMKEIIPDKVYKIESEEKEIPI